MKKNILIPVITCFVWMVCIQPQLFSQTLLSTTPNLPDDSQPVTIIFHADQGNKGLMNYSGNDVYAYTGVITDSSKSLGDWKYVKNAWTVNNDVCKMTKLSGNEYSLTISPGIKAFYNVPAEEKILKLAFVFRNGNASKTGRGDDGVDIYKNVYEPGLHVEIISPYLKFNMVPDAASLAIKIRSTEADSVYLIMDEVIVGRKKGLEFDTTFTPFDHSAHQLVAMAKNNTGMSTDTIRYLLPASTIDSTIPAGINDGITYITDDSVVFSLYAPGKNSIFLMGDFNNWIPDSTYQLYHDGNRFWKAIGGLVPGTEYAFQYLVDKTLRIADPYSEKILDQANDPFIPTTVYPNLKTYPENKTTQIVGVIQPGKPQYSWTDEGFQPPASRDLVIYELLIRDFVGSHDIKDVADTLNYLQKLGVNAIELMPFSEFENNDSWGYNPSFYFAPDKYYGRDSDIKDFINECHNRGIAVIMDIVLNHSYGQNPMVKMYYSASTGKTLPSNPWFNQNSPNSTYSWGFDFNHKSAATQYFVDRVTEYWLTDYHVDGYRFDFTKGFTNMPGDGSAFDTSRINILKRIYNHIQSVNPAAYMICEHFGPNAEEKILANYGLLLWGNSNYNYNEATMGYLNNSDFSWVSYQARGWSNPNLVSYMESHDEERLMYKNIQYGNSSGTYNIKDIPTALKRQELAGAFFFTIPGPKMIWQFGELGYDVSIDFNGRVGVKPVKWDYLNQDDRKHLYLVWAKLIDLRKNYPVFRTNDYTLNVGTNVAMKSIILRDPEEDAVVIGNFGLTSGTMQPGFTSTGWWYELFAGDSLNITDINASVSLYPGEYRIYATKKLESVITATDKILYQDIEVYPNPAMNWLYVNLEKTANAQIYNLSGVMVKQFNGLHKGDSLDISNLPAGFYTVRLLEGNRIRTAKFMKKH